eukprot:7252248-Pyramimonas_sp.AAC.1
MKSLAPIWVSGFGFRVDQDEDVNKLDVPYIGAVLTSQRPYKRMAHEDTRSDACKPSGKAVWASRQRAAWKREAK